MEYLTAVAVLCGIWACMFAARPHVRRRMIWSGAYWLVVLSIGFVGTKLLASDFPDPLTIIPGYWNPDTLFDLGRRTGGYGIEDIFYIFFTGGIASALYDLLGGKRLPYAPTPGGVWLPLLAGVFGAAVTLLLRVNLIYALIAFLCAGTLSLWAARRDLIMQSLVGGSAYAILYAALFALFFYAFPDYVASTYHPENLSGILLSGIPLEELAFALSFGLMWSVLYECRDRKKDFPGKSALAPSV
jgi:hypothetical protein